MKKTILTGIRPTGNLHIGHYFGAVKSWVNLQDEYNSYFEIADVQALTDNFDNPKKVRDNVYELAIDLLSVGIDPKKATIFVQSKIPEIAELTVYYSNLVTMARLYRNPTVKTEIAQKKALFGNEGESVTYGFVGYPVSQAADITAFMGEAVPVGEDQAPILEQDIEIVRTFNSIYGDTLKEPKQLTPENVCKRLPGIDGKNKMSKSLDNYIGIDEEPSIMFEKSMRIPDSCLEDYFRLTTDIDTNTYKDWINTDIVDAHRKFAREIIKMYHGEDFIKDAEDKYNAKANKTLSDNIDTIKFNGNLPILLIDLLNDLKIVSSKSEGRRLIEQNGISVNQEKENNIDRIITKDDFKDGFIIIQKGKKVFLKVMFE